MDHSFFYIFLFSTKNRALFWRFRQLTYRMMYYKIETLCRLGGLFVWGDRFTNWQKS